jgi:hypothetical protein
MDVLWHSLVSPDVNEGKDLMAQRLDQLLTINRLLLKGIADSQDSYQSCRAVAKQMYFMSVTLTFMGCLARIFVILEKGSECLNDLYIACRDEFLGLGGDPHRFPQSIRLETIKPIPNIVEQSTEIGTVTMDDSEKLLIDAKDISELLATVVGPKIEKQDSLEGITAVVDYPEKKQSDPQDTGSRHNETSLRNATLVSKKKKKKRSKKTDDIDSIFGDL